MTQVKFLGSNYGALLADIDADNIPTEYGGTYTGTYNPLYSVADTELRRMMGFESFTVSAGATSTRTVEIAGPGTNVAWYWHLDAYDVTFSASFVPKGGAEDAAVVLVTDTLGDKGRNVFRAPAAGVVTLKFSNSHSRFRKKNVHVRILNGISEHETAVREKSPFSSTPITELDPAELAAAGLAGPASTAADEDAETGVGEEVTAVAGR